MRAGVEHSIIVVEQLGSGPFNRGALLNCGFLAAPETTAAVAILDVDLLPLPGVDFRLPTCDTGSRSRKPTSPCSPLWDSSRIGIYPHRLESCRSPWRPTLFRDVRND